MNCISLNMKICHSPLSQVLKWRLWALISIQSNLFSVTEVFIWWSKLMSSKKRLLSIKINLWKKLCGSQERRKTLKSTLCKYSQFCFCLFQIWVRFRKAKRKGIASYAARRYIEISEFNLELFNFILPRVSMQTA